METLVVLTPMAGVMVVIVGVAAPAVPTSSRQAIRSIPGIIRRPFIVIPFFL
jgi:hypothetical protein